jgi:hypothetical protein
MNIIKASLIALSISAVGIFFSTSPVFAEPTDTSNQATSPTLPATPQIQNSLCAGANLDVNSSCDTGITGENATAAINDLIGDVINIFSLVVGVVAVIMIIIGGFKYITSGGDSSNVSSAKNTILYAIIGLIIVALSQTIVRFVLGRVITA